MNNADINSALIRLQKRADGVPDLHIRESFVEIGSLTDLLSSRNPQVLHGRRGTGKTHTMRYLAELQRDRGDIAIYIDLRNVGSNSSLYADASLPFAERSLRLLLDVAALFHDSLRTAVLALVGSGSGPSLSNAPLLLDAMSDAFTEMRVEGPVTLETEVVDSGESASSRGLHADPRQLGVNLGRTTTEAQQKSRRAALSGVRKYHLNFGSLRGALADVMSAVEPRTVWVLLDEWNSIPHELQPVLADMLRRAFFDVDRVVVKISAVPSMSRFMESVSESSYIGIRVGSDAFADVDLDDYLVYDFDPARSTSFFRSLLARHMLLEARNDPTRSHQAPLLVDEQGLIDQTFTTREAFEEFVKAAEGIPREGMGILGYAAQFAGSGPIGKRDIRRAAKKWFETNKMPVLSARADAERLLNAIIDEVAVKRGTRGFLIDRRRAAESEQFRFLHAERFLHLLKMGISSPDEPGARLDAYVLDYGCYVEKLETRRPPVQLTFFDTEERVLQLRDLVDVPNVDYRTVRRAVLDITELGQRAFFDAR